MRRVGRRTASTRTSPGSRTRTQPVAPTTSRVNHPLSRAARTSTSSATATRRTFGSPTDRGKSSIRSRPFLPQGSTFESQGVVKLPDAVPQQLGITGFFLPSAVDDPTGRPDLGLSCSRQPALSSSASSPGDLGLDNGVPQSVYTLDTTKMKLLATTRTGAGPDSGAAERAGQRDVRRLRPVGDVPDQPRPRQGRRAGRRSASWSPACCCRCGCAAAGSGCGRCLRITDSWAYRGRGRWPDPN